MLFILSTVFAFGEATDRTADEKAIRDHIDKIIRAYIAKDRDTVKRTHSDNWRGFLSGSRTIIRGIDGYMSTVDGQGILNKGNTWKLVDYKFVDYDIVFHGDTGVVSYIAEFFWRDGESKGSYFLRSIDIYAKEKGKWNQVASNIGPLPEEDQYQWSSTFRILSNEEHKRLMKAREEVWYAFFANDTAKLQRLISKETVAINPGNPKFDDQAAIFAAAKAQAGTGAKLSRLEFSNTMIQVYGSTVIMYSNYVLDLDVKGVKETNSGRATEIFVIKGDTIENVGWHLDTMK
jgi:hypothetical protein